MASCRGLHVTPFCAAVAALAAAAATAAAEGVLSTAVPPVVNLRPIIGILTVPLDAEEPCETVAARLGRLHDPAASCFVSLYPKWIEAAGGRAVYIPYNADHATLDALLASVNGVLFTGGGTLLRFNETYLQTAQYIWEAVLAANKRGVFTPLHGTCMGFQTISILAAHNESVLQMYAYQSENASWPVDFTAAAAGTRLWGDNPGATEVFRTRNASVNLHHDGVPPAAYRENPSMAELLVLTSTNVDRVGKPFVSSFVGRDYPITAVQFHPERPLFEWRSTVAINHAPDVIAANRWIADFFVDDARRNPNAWNASLSGFSVYGLETTVEGDVMDGYAAYIVSF
jgi:gamma-glutamyl hydrolase